jgi:Sulfotransferase family
MRLDDDLHNRVEPAALGSPQPAAIPPPECQVHGQGRLKDTEKDAADADSRAIQSHSRPNPEELIAGKRILFLVGGPRSGTTWLQLLLSRSPRIATANETHLFTAYTPSLFSAWKHHQRNMRSLGLHNLMREDEYFVLVKRFVCSVMARIAERNPQADIILEKTPDHVLYWQSILKTFPNAWFLHVVRDPRSVVSSLCAAGAGWGAQWVSREVLENCETWIKYVKESQRLKAASNNFLQVRYEDLWQHGEERCFRSSHGLGLTSALTSAANI